MKEREVYKETYRKGAARVKAEHVAGAVLPFLSAGTTIKAIELRAAGRVETPDGVLEFQDLRVYVWPPN